MGADAVDRIITFDKMAVPAVAEYKYWEARCEKLPKKIPWLFPPVPVEEEDRHYEELHRKYAPQLLDVYMKLGGFYYKSGQKVASNMGGFVPKIYQDVCQPFLNDIPARDPDEVRAVVEAELKRPREEVFKTWEEKPIGCASIGQVHRATLMNGQKVVVKVQNPEAERTFNGDVFALKTLMDVAMPQLSVAFDEIQKQFATEFDYRGECRNAIEIRENLKKAGYKDIIVPEVYPELCSAKLMVMEEISPSIPLHHALDEQAAQMAKQKGVSKEDFVAAEKARIEAEAQRLAKEGKVMESVSAGDYDKYIAVQRLKKWVLRWTVGWWSNEDEGIIVPMNAAKLVDDLLAVHGHEILIDGVFNADPHPGNVLYVDGKLALIDYGQVKRIDDEARLGFAKMILLVEAAIKVDPRVDPSVRPEVHERARKAIAAHARAIGMETEKDLDDSYYDQCVVYMGRMDAAFLYPRNVIQWSDWIQERDPLGNIDKVDYLVMVNTASMMLRGLGEMLQQYRNLAVCWRPMARQALEEKGMLQEVETEINSWIV
eukprot:CAMPEP_0197546278 /NCGR_PEP_ID=MMETSP1320-20131121/940_1 /TAXON_ID=91990 /ORGANISM="Bolidomonas sp., Strain RCC2347" /LENGTH=542 /DNA_ID=CAMNT_0043105829 /DNA_START=116 /DNA_END=1744 /DNA_ORIENTATION=-